MIQRDEATGVELLNAVRETANTQLIETFELCDMLAAIKQEGHWASESESFEDWVKFKSDLDISPREAYYRIGISTKSKLLGIDQDALIAAKISKLKLIFQLNPDLEVKDEATGEIELMSDIIRKLIKDAPFKKLTEIKEIVNRLLNKNVDRDDQLTWMNLPVRRDSKDMVNHAIELATALSGSTVDHTTKEVKDVSTAVAIERICTDFLADPNNVVEELGEGGYFSDDFSADYAGPTAPSFNEIDGELFEEAD